MKWLSLWALDKYEGPLPRSVMQETNDANAIARGDTRRAGWSITGYGMGWQRSSFVGVDVSIFDSLVHMVLTSSHIDCDA